MWKEFKEFIMKGNVLDLAIAVIIGVAFGAVVKSLVDDIIMPIIGKVLGNVDFSGLYINLSDKAYGTLAEAQAAKAPTINYGIFINTIITFLIIAFVLFMIIRTANSMKRQPAAVVVEPDMKDCPYCMSTVPAKATRCLYCTSDLKMVA